MKTKSKIPDDRMRRMGLFRYKRALQLPKSEVREGFRGRLGCHRHIRGTFRHRGPISKEDEDADGTTHSASTAAIAEESERKVAIPIHSVRCDLGLPDR